jgi:hypothetical protein
MGVFHKIPRFEDGRLAGIFAREVLGQLLWRDSLSITLPGDMMAAPEDTMPKRRKQISRDDALQRDLEIVRLKVAGMTGPAIARKYGITGARVTQILHRIAAQIAPRKFKA